MANPVKTGDAKLWVYNWETSMTARLPKKDLTYPYLTLGNQGRFFASSGSQTKRQGQTR